MASSAVNTILHPSPIPVPHLHPDTPYASLPSDLEPTATFATNHSKHSNELQQPPNPSQGNPALSTVSIRSRGFSTASSTSSSSPPVRRKPLPVTASPLATRFSSAEHLASTLELPQPPQPFVRPYSVDSPTLYEFPATSSTAFSPALSGTFPKRLKPLPENSNEHIALTSENRYSPPTSSPKTEQTYTPKSPNLTVPLQTRPPGASPAKHERLISESALSSSSESTDPWYGSASSISHSRSATMSIFSNKPLPPHTIKLEGPVRSSSHPPMRTFSNESNDSSTTIQKSQPKSPSASKLGSFFGWGGTTSPTSSTTTFSDKAYSPIPSPHTPDPNHSQSHVHPKASTRIPPTAIDIPKANADAGGYFSNAYLQLPLATPSSPVQVEEMEKELKDISAELASSIRREMDLEDLVDRLQSEAQNISVPGKRTSDYFSDSGTSSVRFGESDPKQDELVRMQSKTEQEKAQIRLELTEKVQDERTRRKQLEAQIRTLEEKASQVDLVSINSLDANGRLKDLEATCEDLRRRLTEERQVKENFEDLLTALKGELQDSHNERDNLRDEIVPQLRARVEGLEAQAAQHEKLAYEQSKMQQELQTLKDENTTLINAQRLQMEMQQKMHKFNTIAEEVEPIQPRVPTGLTRSNSLAQGSRVSRTSSLSRSTSVKVVESRDALAERVKDIELQRDSLHRALKSLLERQEHQNRENQKKIRQLEMERDRALTNLPKRLGYDTEVANLREEINTLRRRADEAIEQKWQCEKGLSGLKMDLDRAEQEIGSLRTLLQEKDILISKRHSNEPRPGSPNVSSETLERAYKDLQKAYAESLERVKNLEISASKDEETARAMAQLEKSLSDALSERDYAKQEVEELRERSSHLQGSEKIHIEEEMALADELRDSAKRVEELAAQVRQQLASNSTLRQRLAETIERGEKEQKANAQKIMFLQSKLKSLEDELMAAQQASEEKISRHEDDIRDLKESHNVQLQRMKDGLRSPRSFGPKSPLSPLFINTHKAPRIMSTSSGKAMSVSEDSKVAFLKQRVIDLEAALADADREMEEVVGRMNIAQIEVMELQNEREEAVRTTKKLQRQIEEERVRAFEGRFATLSA